jgi:flagellar motility protein MotE (MotC chaperone)
MGSTFLIVVVSLGFWVFPSNHLLLDRGWVWAKSAETPPAKGNEPQAAPTAVPKQKGDDAAALEQKRQQLLEKELELKAKEEELKKLSNTLEKRTGEINAARKAMEETLLAKKKQSNERFTKMVKLLKGMKAEEAGKYMDRLDEKLAIEVLDRLDQKTVLKMIPFLNQPRVLKWINDNLTGK